MSFRVTDLAFPVLCLSPAHNVLHFARHADELLLCSAKALRSGFYQQMEIVDSTAQRYLVRNAEKVGHIGPFWGLNVFGGQTIRVALALEPLPRQSEEALKKQVLQAMHGSEFYDVATETKWLVRSTIKWSTVVAQLAEDFYRKY